jgi:putative flippase GtrA
MTVPGHEIATEVPVHAVHSTFRFLKFLAAGGFAAFVNLLSRYLLTPVIGFKTSIAVAYLLGMAVAFVLFRTFVFGQSGKPVSEETYRFAAVNLVALALVWTISVTLAGFVFPSIGLRWHAEDIAHFIGTCVPAVTSYIGHSLYTFRRA